MTFDRIAAKVRPELDARMLEIATLFGEQYRFAVELCSRLILARWDAAKEWASNQENDRWLEHSILLEGVIGWMTTSFDFYDRFEADVSSVVNLMRPFYVAGVAAP